MPEDADAIHAAVEQRFAAVAAILDRKLEALVSVSFD